MQNLILKKVPLQKLLTVMSLWTVTCSPLVSRTTVFWVTPKTRNQSLQWVIHYNCWLVCWCYIDWTQFSRSAVSISMHGDLTENAVSYKYWAVGYAGKADSGGVFPAQWSTRFPTPKNSFRTRNTLGGNIEPNVFASRIFYPIEWETLLQNQTLCTHYKNYWWSQGWSWHVCHPLYSYLGWGTLLQVYLGYVFPIVLCAFYFTCHSWNATMLAILCTKNAWHKLSQRSTWTISGWRTMFKVILCNEIWQRAQRPFHKSPSHTYWQYADNYALFLWH